MNQINIHNDDTNQCLELESIESELIIAVEKSIENTIEEAKFFFKDESEIHGYLRCELKHQFMQNELLKDKTDLILRECNTQLCYHRQTGIDYGIPYNSAEYNEILETTFSFDWRNPDYSSLLVFLKKVMKLNWVEKDDFIKIDETTIRASKDTHWLEIRCNNKKKPILEVDDGRSLKLPAKNENNNLLISYRAEPGRAKFDIAIWNINKEFFEIEGTPIRKPLIGIEIKRQRDKDNNQKKVKKVDFIKDILRDCKKLTDAGNNVKYKYLIIILFYPGNFTLNVKNDFISSIGDIKVAYCEVNKDAKQIMHQEYFPNDWQIKI